MINRYFFFCITAFLFSYQASAQVFGGNPPAIKWQQINNTQSKIIFSKANDTAAKRIASIIQALQPSTVFSIGEKLKPISIVLQDGTTIANAYVGLAPYRSEFYGTPPQNSFELGSIDWIDQLTIHEYRHVQQYSNFNVGGSKFFHVLFGQQGQALANALTVPDWFFEGDAVYNETQTSTQGRGRLPYFFNGYTSLWEAQKKYSWMKLRNGSLRDFVPDHYKLGYLLTAYGREKYGDEFWKKVTHDAAAMKGFYPFQRAVKKYGGVDYTEFKKDALNYGYKNIMTEESIVTSSKHFLGDEEFVAYTENGSKVYVQSSYKKIPEFVIEENGNKRKIRTRDVSLDKQFDYNKGEIIYASYRPDKRWGYVDYSELQILDVASGKQKTITQKSKYFSPSFNNNNKKIVAVYAGEKEKCSLHILDTNGNLLQEIANPSHYFFSYPKFLDEDKIVSAVRDKKGNMAILLTNPSKNSYTEIVPFQENVIGYLQVKSDSVFFTASYHQKDRLFVAVISSGKVLLLQHPQTNTGDYELNTFNGSYSFSRFTAVGMRLQTISVNDIKFIDVSSEFQNSVLPHFGFTSLNKEPANLLAKVTEQQYDVTTYKKSTKLFNFHSLQPLIEDPDYTFSLLGQNVLNTFQSELFFRYNRNENFKQVGFNGTYAALFPYLHAGVDYTFDRKGTYRSNNTNYTVYWNELNTKLGFSIPLNLSKGRSYTNFNAGSSFVYTQPTFKGRFKDSIGNRTYSYISSFVSFSHQIQKARQHIYPRFAQSISLRMNNMVQRYTGYQFLANGNFYFPGIGINHNLVINAAIQQRDNTRRPSFSNSFPFSRGYEAANLRQMVKWGVNYHLPICYPDWGFGNIVYFLRVRANVFYDYTNAKVLYTNGKELNTQFRSYGTEIFFDTKWWNQQPLNFGFRYSHLLDKDLFGGTGSSRFEFVLPVNLFYR